MNFAKRSTSFLAGNSGTPTNNSAIIHPADHISIAGPYEDLRITSGAL